MRPRRRLGLTALVVGLVVVALFVVLVAQPFLGGATTVVAALGAVLAGLGAGALLCVPRRVTGAPHLRGPVIGLVVGSVAGAAGLLAGGTHFVTAQIVYSGSYTPLKVGSTLQDPAGAVVPALALLLAYGGAALALRCALGLVQHLRGRPQD